MRCYEPSSYQVIECLRLAAERRPFARWLDRFNDGFWRLFGC